MHEKVSAIVKKEKKKNSNRDLASEEGLSFLKRPDQQSFTVYTIKKVYDEIA